MLLLPHSRDVIVVAGLPGAGKTTLVAGEPRALDSDAVRERWAPRLRGVPYPLWRPLVHAWHWLTLWRALARPEGVVVVRPFTRGWLRRAVLRRALRHHPAVHLLVVDATPAQARAGQLARGRKVGERAMERHERRWARAELNREPWTTYRLTPAGPRPMLGPCCDHGRSAPPARASRSRSPAAARTPRRRAPRRPPRRRLRIAWPTTTGSR